MHIPVLLHEVLSGLGLNKETAGYVVDATVGHGGHSKAILEAFPKIHIIANDVDPDALTRSKKTLKPYATRVTYISQPLSGIATEVSTLLAKPTYAKRGGVKAVLYDLGMSSDQIETSGRGFSFRVDEPLLMRLDGDEKGLSARDVVNTWSHDSLELIIRGFGEERYAGRIARAITEARDLEPIETTAQLAEIIFQVVPAAYRHGRIHPATRTFQALRIAVNRELDEIKESVMRMWDVIEPEGVMAVISFHSLEDRIIKHYFADKHKAGEGALVVKKPIVATATEIRENPRSRSAKLRIIKKISN